MGKSRTRKKKGSNGKSKPQQPDRPPIKEGIKRQVRQECFFGCVICGMPLFDYDHIEEYSVVKEHTVQNLTLLCPIHHRQKTSRQLDKETIKEARLNPYNSDRSTSGTLEIPQSSKFEVSLGSNSAHANLAPGETYDCIWINGWSFLAIHNINGRYTFSCGLLDESGRIILAVDQGALRISTKSWDYTYEGNTVTIRRGKGDILLSLTLTNTSLKIHRGIFVDKFGDGFSITNNDVLNLHADGRIVSHMTGCISYDNSDGAFGLLNRKNYLKDDGPGGYGFFQVI